MADDSNPFEDPFAAPQDNPFTAAPAPARENPFAAGKPTGPAASAGLGSTGTRSTAPPSGGFRATASAASTSAVAAGNDAYARGSAYGSAAVAGGADRLDALARREAELEQKEAMLRQKEAELQRALAQIAGMRPNNWPRCTPVMHHDIAGEIPVENQSLTRRLYFLWYFTCLAYLWNFVTQIGALATGNGSGLGFFLSIAYVILAPPITLFGWYKSVYEAFRQGKSSRYVWFFLNFFVQILACIVWLIGLTNSGAVGIVTVIDYSKSKSNGLVIMGVTMIFVWLILLVCSIALIKTVHSVYRGRGGDFQRDAKLLARDGAVAAATASY